MPMASSSLQPLGLAALAKLIWASQSTAWRRFIAHCGVERRVPSDMMALGDATLFDPASLIRSLYGIDTQKESYDGWPCSHKLAMESNVELWRECGRDPCHLKSRGVKWFSAMLTSKPSIATSSSGSPTKPRWNNDNEPHKDLLSPH
jgi:hypothetical protein